MRSSNHAREEFLRHLREALQAGKPKQEAAAYAYHRMRHYAEGGEVLPIEDLKVEHVAPALPGEQSRTPAPVESVRQLAHGPLRPKPAAPDLSHVGQSWHPQLDRASAPPGAAHIGNTSAPVPGNAATGGGQEISVMSAMPVAEAPKPVAPKNQASPQPPQPGRPSWIGDELLDYQLSGKALPPAAQALQNAHKAWFNSTQLHTDQQLRAINPHYDEMVRKAREEMAAAGAAAPTAAAPRNYAQGGVVESNGIAVPRAEDDTHVGDTAIQQSADLLPPAPVARVKFRTPEEVKANDAEAERALMLRNQALKDDLAATQERLPVPRAGTDFAHGPTAGYDAPGGVSSPAERLKPRSELDQIEAQRDYDLHEATAPSVKHGIGDALQVLGAGLTGFAGRPIMPDFQAEQKNRVDAVNAQANSQRDRYLKTPSQLTDRADALPDSGNSQRWRKLVGTITGMPEAVEGMSAEQIKAAAPFLTQYQAARQRGDEAAQKLALQKMGIDQQAANGARADRRDAARLDLERQGLDLRHQEHADSVADRQERQANTVMQEYQTAANSARSQPGYAQALKDQYAIQKAREIFKNPNPTRAQLEAGIEEVGKVSQGGVPGQEMMENMRPNNLWQKAEHLKELITGIPAGAGVPKAVLDQYNKILDELSSANTSTISAFKHKAYEQYKPRMTPQQRATVEANPDAYLSPGAGNAAAPADPFAAGVFGKPVDD